MIGQTFVDATSIEYTFLWFKLLLKSIIGSDKRLCMQFRAGI